MTITLIFAIVIIACVIGYAHREHSDKTVDNHFDTVIKDNHQMNQTTTTPDETEVTDEERVTLTTAEFMHDILVKLGCNPRKNSDGSLFVKYQGETFHIMFDRFYVRVWDPLWAEVRVDDPNLPLIREAVNTTNYSFGPTVVLSDPSDEGVINLHSRRDIMLHPAVPGAESFVSAVLESFFDIKRTMREHCSTLIAEQTGVAKKRRPVGFAAPVAPSEAASPETADDNRAAATTSATVNA